MSPQVEAAWIALLGVLVGVTGTTIVAVTGFRNIRATTEKTLRATRSDLLWARKADAYQDALTASLRRNHLRTRLARVALTEEEYVQAADEVSRLQTRQEWWDMEGRLGAFGAWQVVTAFSRSRQADEDADVRHRQWSEAADATHSPTDLSVSDSAALRRISATARRVFEAALEDAIGTDDDLERAIREDLKRESDGIAPGHKRRLFRRKTEDLR